MKLKTKTPDQRLRMVGRQVSNKLRASRAKILEGKGATIYCVHDFLTRDECDELIEKINRNRAPSTLYGDHPDKEFRTSDTCYFDREDPLIAEIDQRISDFIGLDKRFGETVQAQVYEVGQQYKAHFDWFLKGSTYWDHSQSTGGQRSWTTMAYLNEPAAGGATDFPTAGLSVRPITGMLCIWDNNDSDGRPNNNTLHAGTPVDAGTKYIITKWYRERFWG